MPRQYVITGTKTFTYYKTVQATDIVDAHVKAHLSPEDPIDDWTSDFDESYDEPIPMVIKHIEDEGAV